MTAVISATDVLRRDRHMSFDDNSIKYIILHATRMHHLLVPLYSYSASSTDWREKYNEVGIPFSYIGHTFILCKVADMLAETRAELDDFHHASKELETELENELQRTEKAQQDLKVKVIRAESERDDWKVRCLF